MDVASGVVLEWPLVGRADELEFVERSMARSGGAGVVLAGAAGVGKTRLARCFLERAAAAGCVTAWVQATRSAGAVPFGAFAHLLPAELGTAGPVNLLGVAGQAVAVRAGDGRLVLGVDDAHLLDASSAALVRYLATSAVCFVVVTVRNREPVPDAIVSLWKDGPLERIELQSLAEHEVVALVRSALGGHVDRATLHRLWQASQGNPLYLRELVLGGVDSSVLASVHGVWCWHGASLATPRLTELVESRLGDLSSNERRMLEVVAQAEPLEAWFLDGLCGQADRDSLERRGLLETITSERRRTLRLSHPLYSEAVRAATPPSTVPVIWHRLADLLAGTGARRAGDLLRLATWRLGGRDPMDAEFVVAAAQQAISVQDFSLAERLARAAVDTYDSFETRLLLATVMIGLGRRDDAELLLTALQTSAESDEQRALAALRRTDNLYGLGRLDDSRAVLGARRERRGSTHWRDTLMVAAARIECFGGDAESAVPRVLRVLDRPNVGPDVLVEAAPVAIWGQIVTGRSRVALELGERLLPVAEQLAGGRQVMFTPGWLRSTRSAALLVQGRLEEVDTMRRRRVPPEHCRDGRRVARDSRLHARVGEARRGSTPVGGRHVRGDDRRAPRRRPLPCTRAACLGELAHCHALVGDVAAARTALADADSARVPSFVMDYSFVELARAWVSCACGEVSLARRLAAGCAEQCASYGQVVFEAFAWHDLARLGSPAAAVGPLRAVAERVDGELIPTFAAHAAALAAGDAAGLQHVATAFERMGALLYAAEAAAGSGPVVPIRGQNGQRPGGRGVGTAAHRTM